MKKIGIKSSVLLAVACLGISEVTPLLSIGVYADTTIQNTEQLSEESTEQSTEQSSEQSTEQSTTEQSTIEKTSAIEKTPKVQYSTYIQDKRWLPQVENGAMSGTSGKKLRMESLKISLADLAEGTTGGISYSR
ncbi:MULTISPECIES: hypothetical protein [unclassified Lactococcus]|uniref:hypothetical protein n=1 Tax=unclassified Lactococcus TaxID=2643510 RepID=UPI0011C82602|nr:MULTISPECIES: hypothetical protein [unclassified Lactococcus]MQW24057.1 hypothetical protein [Lactococcus sp. dk101]TXK36500.1 hypothetical protein FVP42_11220 [Lactococcus sp. dk310]TXK47165.1 hypothetical protein FVP43_10420 [Lactococcus sp. dk322]